MDAEFEFATIASPLHDERSLATVTATLTPGLARLGGVPAGDTDGSRGRRPFVVVALTGGTEARMLEAWHERQAVAPWEPFVVVAHGGHNSLPAALEAVARVQQDGGRGRIVYIDENERGWADLARIVDDLRVRIALEGLRIGQVGAPSDWLVASSPPVEVVARRWGPTVVAVDIEHVVEAVSGAQVMVATAADVVARATGVHGPVIGDVDLAAQALPALRHEIEDARLDAVTVRCFDLVTAAHTSGCLALSELNDRSITAGCEGDMVSTIAMVWLRLLLDTVPWMANPVRLDAERNTILLAHCTIARSLVRSYRLRTHFESGLGVAIDGDIDAHEVTLVRIGGRDLGQLWVAEAEVLPAPHEEDLCRTQLHLHLDRGVADDLLRAPLGNHLVVVPGRHADRVTAWWELLVAD